MLGAVRIVNRKFFVAAWNPENMQEDFHLLIAMEFNGRLTDFVRFEKTAFASHDMCADELRSNSFLDSEIARATDDCVSLIERIDNRLEKKILNRLTKCASCGKV